MQSGDAVEDSHGQAAASFLLTLWPEPCAGGRIGVGSLKWQQWFELTPEGITSASEHADKLGTDVYFTVCAHDRTEGCRNSASATFAPALWVDLDFEKAPGDGYPTIGQARTTLPALGVPPSVVVDSGRGWHLYWLLDEPMPASEAAALCWRWQEYVRRSLPAHCRLDSTADAARVLRVPGTVNGKCQRQVEATQTDGRRYSAEELAGLLDELGIERGKQSPASGELQDGGLPLPIATDDPRIQAAIKRTQPDHVGTGNRKVFQFVRELKALPELKAMPAGVCLPYIRNWYERHYSMLEGVTLKKAEQDFATGWRLVKFPVGAMRRALERAAGAPDPRAALLTELHGFRTARLMRTLALCLELGEDGRSFPLSSHLLGDWLGCAQPKAYGYLAKLMQSGLIEVTEKGSRGTVGKHKANEYRLTRLALHPPTSKALPSITDASCDTPSNL